MRIAKRYLTLIILCLSLLVLSLTQVQQDDFHISDQQDYNQNYENDQNNKGQTDENASRQMQYLSQRRTACLVLSRYYLNQYSQDIQAIVGQLQGQDQQKFINKLYTSAVEKCEPIIQTNQVYQFFTQNKKFDPSHMFYIFDGFNFNQLTLSYDDLSPNQQNILKFIKNFDSEMQIRKQEEKAQKLQLGGEQGIQLFFIPVKNLPASMKYIYIVLVLLIAGGVLWWALGQIGQKPTKKSNKRRKKQ